MITDKQKKFLLRVAYYGTIAGLSYLAMKYLLSPVMPFIFGFLFAWFLHKPAKWIGQKLHMHYRYPAFALATVWYVTLSVVVLLAGVQIISALENFIPQIPTIYTSQVLPAVNNLFDQLEMAIQNYDPSVGAVVEKLSQELLSYLQSLISTISVGAVKLLSSIVTGAPSFILRVIVMVVSTFFVSMDYEHIVEYLLNKLPQNKRKNLTETVDTGVRSIRTIIGAYGLIMCLSFVELSIGFLLLKIPYAIALALLIAVVDILPVLGTGLFLIPWAIIAAVMQNYSMAIGIALLYIFMLIVRNVVEPKLVGKQMGLHPLATLVSMFVGLNMFGIMGLFGFPIALSLYFKMSSSKKERFAKEEVQPESSNA